MRIYAISGLGADERVFKHLKLNNEIVPIKWVTPKRKESLQAYSIRMAQRIDISEPFGIMGVSFGGLVSAEISKVINPSFTILISSVEVSAEIPIIYRLFGKTHLIKIIPTSFFALPKKLAHYLFGTKNLLLDQILNDSDLRFTKWSIDKLLIWKSDFRLNNCLKIGGSKDRLLPPKDHEQTELIKGGHHFMIVDRAKEISELINMHTN